MQTKLFRLIRLLIVMMAGIAVLAYLGAAGYLYVNQRSILYRNRSNGAETPHVRGVPITDLRLPTPDGESLEAWYSAPAPAPGKPVFLFFHGKGSALAEGEGRYVRMHDEGVGFLALAYRGYSGSSGHPTENGLLTDGLAAYDWLVAKGYRPSDIVIHGHSLGTGVAVYVATKRSAKAIILEAPFTAASDVAQEQYPFMPVPLLMKDKYLSRERIKDVHMPLLIIHGDRDETIPFAEGQRLFELANQPKMFIRMPGSHHNTLPEEGAYERYWQFLGLNKESLGAAGPNPR